MQCCRGLTLSSAKKNPPINCVGVKYTLKTPRLMTNTRCIWYWAWSHISGLSWAQTCCRDLTNWFALYPTFRHWFNYNCLFPKRPSPSAVLSYPAGQKLVCAPGFADSIQSTLLQTRTYKQPKNEAKTFIIYFWHRRCSSSHNSLYCSIVFNSV